MGTSIAARFRAEHRGAARIELGGDRLIQRTARARKSACGPGRGETGGAGRRRAHPGRTGPWAAHVRASRTIPSLRGARGAGIAWKPASGQGGSVLRPPRELRAARAAGNRAGFIRPRRPRR
jgi:hypothetical protein